MRTIQELKDLLLGSSKIPVTEIFGPVIQGEGMMAGYQTLFLRLAGCDYCCLAQGTRILRPDGQQTPIEDLRPGDKVVGYARLNDKKCGPLRTVEAEVLDTRHTGTKPTFAIHFEDGTVLHATEDHRLWVEKLRNGWVWKSPKRPGLEGNYREVRELRPGMYVKGPGKRLHTQPDSHLWRHGYLAGAMQGDGHIGKGWIGIGVCDKDFFQAFLEVSRVLGVPMNEHAETRTPIGTPFFKARLPERYRKEFLTFMDWQTSKAFARGYLAGMFDAEGHIPSGEAYFTNKNQLFINRTCQALEILGYSYAVVPVQNDAFRVVVHEAVSEFVTNVRLQGKKRIQGIVGRGWNQERVLIGDIIPEGSTEVYDISTTTENFVAEGLVVHNCSFCDTLYSVLPKLIKENSTSWSQEDLLQHILKQGELTKCRTLTISGGNPVIHNLLPLVEGLNRQLIQPWQIAVETQGTVWKDWLREVQWLTISPKPPSSGMRTNWKQLDYMVAQHWETQNQCACLKVVVFDDFDYEYAVTIHNKYRGMPFYVQPGTTQLPALAKILGRDPTLQDIQSDILTRTQWLAERVCADKRMKDMVRVMPQIHSLMYGYRKGV